MWQPFASLQQLPGRPTRLRRAPTPWTPTGVCFAVCCRQAGVLANGPRVARAPASRTTWMAVVRPRLAFSRVSTACHGKCWTSPTHRGRWYLLHSATPSWCSTSSFGPGQRLQYVSFLL